MARSLKARGLSGPLDLWLVSHAAGPITFTSLAAAPTITDASSSGIRRVLDLQYVEKWSSFCTLGTGQVAGGKAGFQYSVDGGSTWFWIDGTDGSAPPATDAPIMVLNANAVALTSSVIRVPSAARTATTLMRFAATGGNGSASPALRSVTLIANERFL